MASYLPITDAGLQAWGTNFLNRIMSMPADYGLTTGQATEFETVLGAYGDALRLAVDPITRTRGAIAAKNTARGAMKDKSRELAGIVQAHPGVSDAQLINLGLNVRKQPSPVPVPADSPEMDIMEVKGRTVTIRLHDGTAQRRKPAGVTGAALFSYVGQQPPVDAGGWKFEGNTGKTVVEMPFGGAGPEAVRVWLTAFWFNARGSGPGCEPRSVNLAAGVAVPVATMRLAA